MLLRLPNCRCLLLLCLMATSGGVHAAVEALVPPPGYRQPVGNSGVSQDCPAPPAAFDGELNFPSKYEGSDQARDQLNPEADEAYRERTRPITEFERGLSGIVHRYLVSGRRETLQCAIDWYLAWADGEGLLGDASTHTGRAIRKWALATISGHWLHLKFSSTQPLAEHPDARAPNRTLAGRHRRCRGLRVGCRRARQALQQPLLLDRLGSDGDSGGP